MTKANEVLSALNEGNIKPWTKPINNGDDVKKAMASISLDLYGSQMNTYTVASGYIRSLDKGSFRLEHFVSKIKDPKEVKKHFDKKFQGYKAEVEVKDGQNFKGVLTKSL